MPALTPSRQLLVVIAPHWQSCSGRLQRFSRMGPGDNWQLVGAPIDVMLGRSGLAWGRGLHGHTGSTECIKQEGDGCAPAGIFAITALFGYAAQESSFAQAAKLPYLSATPDLKAIDDPASAHYNQIIDQSTVPPDWASCEEMLRDDSRYALGAVVAHNAEPPLAGAGSCIFMHVWAGEGQPTAGCTAMSLTDMTQIATWLDAAAAPRLVLLPRLEYEQYREDWHLPECPM